jgi:ketosteroid isomerase-like protein
MSLYADDAISMPHDSLALIGKAAIQKDDETSADNSNGRILVTYITEEVFGDEQLVTERGNVIDRDATGKVACTEKHIQIW